MTDAQESSKLFSKRWRAKIFSNEDAPGKELKSKLEAKLNLEKPNQNYKQDAELDAFLKPSTQRANSQKEAATAAFLAGANKPRIDVAKAQRWPGAHDLPGSAVGNSPSIAGGLRTGTTRKKGLTVSFSRTQPDIIGEGGDECAEPSIEVFKRKKSNSLSDLEKLQAQTHQDDSNLGTRSPKFNSMDSANQQAQNRGIVTRTLTSHGELSPPLQQKLDMGHINTQVSPQPPTPHRLGQMGLGERRPKPLQRTQTGFDVHDEGAGRPSMDSTFSNDSDNMSPAAARKAPNLPTTLEEEENFRLQPLKRTQTGWSEHGNDSDESVPSVPAVPRLHKSHTNDDDSPLDSKALLAERFLQNEPVEPNSFSARAMHRMRAEEGKALHEAARRAAEDSKRDSASSTNSFQPNTFQAETPPKPPSRPPHREPLSPTSTQKSLDAEDPHRSRARGASPGRRPMPPGTFPLDTDARPPSSASSQYTVPSAASKTRSSPTGAMDPFSTTSSRFENPPFSAVSVQQTPTTYEKNFASVPVNQNSRVPSPPQPPPHAQPPTPQTSNSYNTKPASSQRREPAPTMPLVRSDTKSQGEIAFADFAQRVTHMQGIFRLTAELGGSLYSHSLMQWLRVAIWWFLSGRAGMETLIRSRPKNGEAQPERLTQPHVDLAKTWWIVSEIVPNHPSLRKYGDQKMDTQAKLAKDAGDAAMAEVYEVHDIILYYMKMLLGSMKRHQSMPPTQALIQGQDQSVWIEYPNFAPDAHSVLSGTTSKPMLANGAGQPQINPSLCIPLGDTKTDFCYFRMFVKASLSTDDPNTDRIPLPIIISVLRPRDSFKVKLAICSQSDLVNITVGPSSDAGLTWRDVTWKSKTRGFTLQMRHGFNLNVDLSEQDFRSLWSIVDHTNRVDGNLRERSDERLSCQMYLREVSYRDSTNPGAFPSERVKGCKLMAFEKFERSNEGGGKRRLHRGYRLVVITNANIRTLSCINHEMGTKQEPMNFEYFSDGDSVPGMTLRFKEEVPNKKPRNCRLDLVFNDSKDRNQIFGTFTSMNMGPDEDVFAQVPLKGFSIESADPADGFSHSGNDVLKKLQWQEAKVLNIEPVAAGMEAAPTVKSESLRIVCKHGAGVISDRMNLGPGELLVRLPIDGAAELTLLRNPQQDMSVAVDATRTPDKGVPDELAELLKTLTSASTIRRLTFDTFKDLHTFQLAVTGFHVKFDGLASTFSISRRRMVVPIYKQWTANKIRLQIVEQDNIIQLVAFFQDFSHADAMNFQLKSMDVVEKLDKGGKSCVRLVDAKFPLPVEERRGEGKMGKEEGKISGWAGMKRKFVCMDIIEYPGEHDDIVIAFESAETRDRFVASLPAAAEMSRKFTVRRK